MYNLKQFSQLLLSISLTLTLAACGGGGDSAQPAATYSGLTTPAAVTTTNAKTLSVDAYQGGQIGTSMSAIGAVRETTALPVDAARLQQLATILTSSVRQVVVAKGAPAVPVLVGATASDTIYGYSGSFSFNIAADEATGAFSGSLTFSNFQSVANAEIISGSVSFSGSFNQATESFTSISMTVTSLVITTGNRTATASGAITLSHVGTSETIAMTLVLSDSTTGRTYWVKNFTFSVSATGSETLTGTYYDPIHGYVTISTVTPLVVGTTDSWPTAGQLLFTGANGSKARLTFSATGYTVEVDAAGNGTFVLVP